MRISASLSTVNIPGARKVYLWPAYPENELSPVRKVTRQGGTAVYFRKADDDFREHAIRTVQNPPKSFSEISPRHAAILPGILFDARA